ncbi:MAG: hypothetical protein M5U01_06550 [Ardenticatenaceae bacterium]|nr:hypothetical protein [Ardenticatenaceae bacterium]
MDEPTKGVISIKWPENAGDVPTHYANMLWITHGGPEFFLVFGEIVPPPPGSSVPEQLTVRPIAKIAISPLIMPEIARIIHDNVEKFLRQAKVDVEEG